MSIPSRNDSAGLVDVEEHVDRAPAATLGSLRFPEFQILPDPGLAEQNNLSSMHAEMFDDVVDRFQDVNVVSLNSPFAQQLVAVNLLKHGIRLRHDRFQAVAQFG